MSNISRRKFLKGAGVAALAPMSPMSPMSPV